jgi:hypothetical protein
MPSFIVLLIAVVGVVSSVIVGTMSANLGDVLSGEHSTHEAFAGKYPLVLDHNYKLEELSGEAKMSASTLEVFDAGVIDPDQHCEFCTLLKYSPGDGEFAGIAYFTDKPMDLSGAKRVTLAVMGEEGGEKIKLGIAGKKVKADGEVKYAFKTKTIRLTDDWTPIQIDLTKAIKKDLVDITRPFEIQVIKSDNESNVYFKYVTFDQETAENPIESIYDKPPS